MPFPFCHQCGLRHRRDIACQNGLERGSRALYRLSGLMRDAADGNIAYVSPQVPHSCGVMDGLCPFCRSKFWSEEHIGCCNKGDIHFNIDFAVPPEMQELLSSSHFTIQRPCSGAEDAEDDADAVV